MLGGMMVVSVTAEVEITSPIEKLITSISATWYSSFNVLTSINEYYRKTAKRN